MDEDILVYIEEMNKLREMLQKNILDANKRKTWLDKYKDKINRRKDSNFIEVDGTVFYSGHDKGKENSKGSLDYSKRVQEEYIKFLDYRGKNLFVSRRQLSIGQFKGYATLAVENKVEGKVIEIDKGEIFIIGDYVSKEQGETDEEHRR